MSAVLITGASGYLGRKLVRALARRAAEAPDGSSAAAIVATDLRSPPEGERVEGVTYERFDVREPTLGALLAKHSARAVVHLASIVNPGPDTARSLQREVDVEGTRRVIDACLSAGVRQLIVTSSGAAYGYHEDNPPLLTEGHPLRGNDSFAYAQHKREVEEMLAKARVEHPELAQLVLRPGTILGDGARNQITDIFTRPVVLGLRESETPFVFVLDDDVVRVIVEGLAQGWTGEYNLAGEGVLTLREIAAKMGRPFVALPERAVRAGLTALRAVGATRYGPEQTAFLRARPVLSADKIARERGVKLMPTRAVFERWRGGTA